MLHLNESEATGEHRFDNKNFISNFVPSKRGSREKLYLRGLKTNRKNPKKFMNRLLAPVHMLNESEGTGASGFDKKNF